MQKPPIELLERCKHDDRKAHYDLYRMCFGFLVNVCRRYYNNPEDVKAILNLVFLKIIQNMSSYLDKYETVPFELWIRRIAINCMTDEFRKNKSYKQNTEFTEVYESEDVHPLSDPTLAKEKLEVIMNAINQLPEMNRTVFNLHTIDGYKHAEIADMLNISLNTSKAHLHQAKEKLKAML